MVSQIKPHLLNIKISAIQVKLDLLRQTKVLSFLVHSHFVGILFSSLMQVGPYIVVCETASKQNGAGCLLHLFVF